MLRTLCGKQVSADKRCIYIFQQYDALLRCHAQEVVETVVWKGSVTQAHQTDAVTQLTCQSRAEMSHTDVNCLWYTVLNTDSEQNEYESCSTLT